jgi:hypothetical protein
VSEVLVRVVADGGRPFVAGFVVHDNVVTVTAPILRRFLLGKTADQARAVIKRQGWRASIVR